MYQLLTFCALARGMHNQDDFLVPMPLAGVESDTRLFRQTGPETATVECLEASAFTQLTPAPVRYRVVGLQQGPDGTVRIRHRVMAKVSRVEVAPQFLESPKEGRSRLYALQRPA